MADIVFILNGVMDRGVFSGGDRHTVGLAQYCAQCGDTIRIIGPEAALRGCGNVLGNLDWLLTEKGDVPSMFSIVHTPSVLLKYLMRTSRGRSLMAKPCDIIYSGSILPHEVMIASAWKKRAMCKRFVCRCDQIFHYEPFRQHVLYVLHRMASRAGMRVVLKSSDLVIAMNRLIESQWSDAKRDSLYPKIETLSYGLDGDFSIAGKCVSKKYDAAFFTRLDYVKGADLLPDILACTVRKMPGFKMLVIGDGSLAKTLKRRIHKLGLDKNVFWQGAVNSDQRFEMLTQSRVLLYPTREDSFAKSVAEAMALGLPVVSSNNPHLRSVYSDAMIYVEPGAPDNYADALCRLIESECLYNDFAGRSLAFAKNLPPLGNYSGFRDLMMQSL